MTATATGRFDFRVWPRYLIYAFPTMNLTRLPGISRYLLSAGNSSNATARRGGYSLDEEGGVRQPL